MKNREGSCVRPVDTVVNKKEIDRDGGDRGGAADDTEVSYEEEIHAAPAEDPPVKVVKDPGMPTKAEYDEHTSRGHLPFRAWCPFCVMGKAPEDPHWKKKVKIAGEKPTLSMDYKSFGQTCTNEEEEGEKVTALIMRDGETTNTFSHVVEEKGKGDGWIVRNRRRHCESGIYRRDNQG